MTPIDIMPPQATPVKAAAGRPSKGEDAKEDNGDGGFAGAMKQVAKDKKQPNAAERQQGHAKETEDAGARLPMAERTERRHRFLTEGEVDGKAQADTESDDGEPQASEQGASGNMRGVQDVLAMMAVHARGHDNRSATHREDKQAASSIDVREEQPVTGDKDTAAALEKLNVLSIKTETHLARANAQPVATDVAQKLAQFAAAQPVGARKGGEPATKTTALSEPNGGVKAHDAEAGDAVLPKGGQPGAEVDASQGGLANLAGGGRGAKEDAKLALRALGPAEAANAPADKAQPSTPAGSPVEQLMPRLLDTAREMKSAEPGAATATTNGPHTPAAGPIRVLSIDLHPAELGAVTVRMSLSGETLGVQIEAHRPETARLLQSDASALSDMLRTAGVQVDGVVVRAANMDAVSGNTGSGQSFMQGNSQSQPGGAQQDARASGGNGREQDRQPSGDGGQDQGRNGQQRPERVAGRGLYV